MDKSNLTKNHDPFLIYSSDYFDVKHVSDVLLPGYLIIYAKNSIKSIADMSSEQSQDLIAHIQKTQTAIQEVLKPEKIYLLSFCEVLSQFHLHLFPRTKELATHFHEAHSQNIATPINGAMLFDWARKNYVMQNIPADVEDIIKKIKQYY